MSYTGIQPVPQATWSQREGVVQSDTSTLQVEGGYEVGYLTVFIEGRKLKRDEFSATDGTSVTFTSVLPAGTNYMFEKVTPFTVYSVRDGLVQQITASTANTPIDVAYGGVIVLTLTTDTTLSFVNLVSPATIRLTIIQDATGGRTVTWPAGARWSQGQELALSTDPNARDVFQLWTDEDTTVSVALVGVAMS